MPSKPYLILRACESFDFGSKLYYLWRVHWVRPTTYCGQSAMMTKDSQALRSAPFETPPAAAPQDGRARLEGRETVMQRARPGRR
jgi:hypothetical protein